MLFNSLIFLIFFLLFFVTYWLLNNKLRWQNFFVLVSSYVFYGWWDWRFLGLIFLSTLIDYFVGLSISTEKRTRFRTVYLGLSILANIGLLVYFKYFNFFISEFELLLNKIGFAANMGSLNIILPVGISFYTFQTLSYTIDVYRDKLQPTKDFINFAAFVSFFPQLVAGPIERATHLLSQFNYKRKFDFNNAKIGLSQILWGYFKKVVIADNCAVYVDEIFSQSAEFGSFTLILGAILFAFQIYGDFSGYSDIAIGISRLLGFRLMTNFRYPYFSRDIAEFWRRWHISLSTWFRDYIYIPLGGSRVSTRRNILNVFIIFIVSGIWHGANWTFAVWGFLNALYFIPLFITNRNRSNLDTIGNGGFLNTIKEIPMVLLTFSLTCIAWIFFRSESITEAVLYLGNIFQMNWESTSTIIVPSTLWILIILLIMVDFLNRKKDYVYFNNVYIQSLFIIITGNLILLFGYFEEERSFIYFQF